MDNSIWSLIFDAVDACAAWSAKFFVLAGMVEEWFAVMIYTFVFFKILSPMLRGRVMMSAGSDRASPRKHQDGTAVPGQKFIGGK